MKERKNAQILVLFVKTLRGHKEAICDVINACI